MQQLTDTTIGCCNLFNWQAWKAENPGLLAPEPVDGVLVEQLYRLGEQEVGPVRLELYDKQDLLLTCLMPFCEMSLVLGSNYIFHNIMQ
jgi:hypothetical protein